MEQAGGRGRVNEAWTLKDKGSVWKWNREDRRSDKKCFQHEVPGTQRAWLL